MVCGDVGASSGRAEEHAPPEPPCGFGFFFFFPPSRTEEKEVNKRRLKRRKERMDVSAGRKTSFHGEIVVEY